MELFKVEVMEEVIAPGAIADFFSGLWDGFTSGGLF